MMQLLLPLLCLLLLLLLLLVLLRLLVLTSRLLQLGFAASDAVPGAAALSRAVSCGYCAAGLPYGT